MLNQIGAAAGVAEQDMATGARAALSHLGPDGPQGEPMDLRKSPHFQVHLPMSFSGDRVAGEGTVYNLSTGGCKAESDTAVKTGAYLRVRLSLPDQDSSITIEVAAVRWAMGRDFGVEFISLPPDDQEHLRQFLKILDTSPGT